jgi:KDO2-lipid IV(A) lauroyltransferase
VDVRAATQLVTDVVERWVRDNPGQWMWFHKRWELDEGQKVPPVARPASQS